MRVWLITVGEPLPTDDNNNCRLLRTGILANLLDQNGCSVVWWTSSFNHTQKMHRFTNDDTLYMSDNYQIKLLHSVGYKKNISIKRLINHWVIAYKFFKYSHLEICPDIIICSLPTIELSLAAVRFGKERNIPVIVDIRDLWPDIFLDLAPIRIQPFFRLLLSPLFKAVHSLCAGATAITGITPAFVDWGLEYAGRTRKNADRDFPLGYSRDEPDTQKIIQAEAFWGRYELSRNDFIICFFGTISRQFELETVIRAARTFEGEKQRIHFVICGSGDSLEYYKNMAQGCRNVIFPGWVGRAEIWTLMRMSAVGLAPYISSKDFMGSIPNKAIEYLSAGLPVISSLKGLLKDLLSNHNCGITYENNNADELVSTLKLLYDNPGKIKEMSKNAFSLYDRSFAAEKVYNEMADYLIQVCKNYNAMRGCN